MSYARASRAAVLLVAALPVLGGCQAPSLASVSTQPAEASPESRAAPLVVGGAIPAPTRADRRAINGPSRIAVDEPALFVPELDEEIAAQLQAAIERAQRGSGLPGVSVAIALPNGARWSGTSGVVALATGEPLPPGTLFNVASITKTYVAALVMQLAEENVVPLDEPLARWVPEAPNADRITIRQLLGHTSGLRDFFTEGPLTGALLADPGRWWTPQEVIATVGPPYAEPGTAWRYSNTNYLLLGMVVERATGSTVSAELRRRFFEPLGLQQTFMQPNEVPSGLLAVGHTITSDIDADGRPDATSSGGAYRPDLAWSSSVWTAGALVATTDDVATWGDALFGGRVLLPESLEQMRRFGGPADYGLGLMRKRLGGREWWGHSGGLRGVGGLLMYFPEERLTFVILANRDRVDYETLLQDRYGGDASIIEAAVRAARSATE